jgi:hypothetical protein
MPWISRIGLPFAALLALPAVLSAGVELEVDEAARRVDVKVDGKPFTSYIWPERLKKPVLYPIRTADGTVITRGFPLDPRPGERVDHPHHVGLWLNHGDVNGLDFWNNSEAVEPTESHKFGTIVHRAIKRVKNGKNQAELDVSMDWVTPEGKTLLHEDTTFVFHAGKGERAIDRITTLTAQGERVVFTDSKEGMLGLRVVRALEQPADKAEIFTDASGKPTAVPVLDNKGVTGRYLTSEGLTGDAVWATRARWASLSGTVEGKPVTIAILDDPKNPEHPPFWHARGYGLFAVNPFGHKAYTNGKQELNYTLQPKQSVTLRHRVLVLSSAASPAELEKEFGRFVGAQAP